MILSQVLEKATGRSIGDLLREGILDRLGMKNTTPPDKPALPDPVLNQDDIHKFVEAVGSGSLVSKASHDAQLAPVTVGLGSNTPEKYRALGFGVVNGWVFMSPGLQGLKGGAANLPGKNLTIVALHHLDAKVRFHPVRGCRSVEQLTAIFAPDQPAKL